MVVGDDTMTEHTVGLSRRNVLKAGVLATGGLATGGLVGQAGATPGQGAGNGGQCEHVVPDDHPTIQDAVDSASAGDTICIQPGTYDEDVAVDTGVSLHGATAPNSTNPVHVDGQITVEPGADGTTISRLRIAPTGTFPGGTFPDPAGVLVKASDVTVENNIIEGLRADLSDGGGSFTLHGVQVFNSGVSDVTIQHNVIRDFESDGDPTGWPKYGGVAGVKLQADVEAVTVRANEIADLHSAGWAWGVVLTSSGSAAGVPQDVTVEKNHISGVNDGSKYDVFSGPNGGRDAAPYPGSAFGIDGAADASEATLVGNNLLAPNGAESKDQTETLVAACNWWGDRSGPTHDDNSGGEGTWALERGSATIDYSPWLIAPAPSKACKGQ